MNFLSDGGFKQLKNRALCTAITILFLLQTNVTIALPKLDRFSV